MARYGTWEREQELIALEREDREVWDDEPSGGNQAELAREAAWDLRNEGMQDERPDDEGPVPGLLDVDLTYDGDDLENLPF